MTGISDDASRAGAAEQPPPIAEVTAALDSVVHHPVRLGILTITAAAERCAFSYLKSTLDVTDGNLSRNIAVLEEHGLIDVAKGYEGRRPRTWVSATDAGRTALSEHLAALRAMAAWTPQPATAPPTPG